MATNPKETSGTSGASDEEIEAKFRLIAVREDGQMPYAIRRTLPLDLLF
jgi:hypothetical protein